MMRTAAYFLVAQGLAAFILPLCFAGAHGVMLFAAHGFMDFAA
ncbi:hypothetical protein [Pseudomonas shahriarae]|nr:hypothetical protein [Pseudomonas shahriarae]